MKVVIASNNKGKISELRKLLNDKFEIFSLADIGFTSDIEENGTSFEENAKIKAKAVASDKYITIADDSGLAVDKLGGMPGIFSMRWSGGGDAENNEKLLRELKDVPKEQRNAAFICVVACIFPDGKIITTRGECRGTILREYNGRGGFGYDPLFYYEPYKKTFAQMTIDEKGSISHRGIAMKKLSEILNDYL